MIDGDWRRGRGMVAKSHKSSLSMENGKNVVVAVFGGDDGVCGLSICCVLVLLKRDPNAI